MTLKKFAAAQVLEARIARRGAGLVRDAHRHTFNYEPKPGFLYVRSRAISSRTNDNFDHFPAEEIKKAYRTFIGKPVFVNHHNDNHRRARGVIVDAALHEDANPDGSPDTWAEVLMEVDAVNFPKLAQAIIAGEIDRTSMGTDVAFSVCSVCNNKASTPLEYCQHIPRLKGKKIRRRTASGGSEDVLVYEKCYGLGFFENSLLVEQPADPTAYFLGVDTRGLQTAASKTATMVPSPLDPSLTVPDYVAESYYLEHPHKRPLPPPLEPGTLVPAGGDLLNPGDPFDGYEPEVAWDRDLLNPDDTGHSGRDLLAHSKVIAKAAAKQGALEKQTIAASDVQVGDRLDSSGKTRVSQRHPRTDKVLVQTMTTGTRSPSIAQWEPTEQITVWRDSAKTALNETLAPAKVDTLRDEQCPVCGEADSYDGDKCRVCGFIRPPAEFMDPDLGKARQVDLRQDQQDAAAQPGGTPPQDHAADPHAPQGHPLQDGAAQPDYMKQSRPKGQQAPAAAAPAAGGTPLWQQKERPKSPAGGAHPDKGAPGGAATAEPLWKQRTRPKKSAGLNTQKEQSMRPALAALAEQQKKIDSLTEAVTTIASLAGLEAHPAVTALRKHAEDENPAQPKGWANPGGPGSEAPAETTEQASKPSQGTDSVESTGEAPGNDVQPDAKTSLDSNETVLDTPLDLNEQDPTKAVSGTDNLGEGQRGNAGTNRTETDVRVGDPNKPQVAFEETGWKNASAQPSEGRVVAAIRLARLRIEAGIATGDDLGLGATIASSDMTDEAIQTEINTISQVRSATVRQQPTVDRRLVPQVGGGGGGGVAHVARTVPSMVSEEPFVPQQKVAYAPSDDEFAFE